MRKFRAPKFAAIGRHGADPSPLKMGEDSDSQYAGAHRREGRHGISPATRPEQRMQHPDMPTGAPAGQHRRGRATQDSAGARRATSDVWYPTKTDWRRLVEGETVNGYRLTSAG